MRKSIFSRPSPNESIPRNSFDRSARDNFTISAGLLLPTFSKFVLGKSRCKINQRSFFRSSAVNTACFMDFPIYTDYFFVPMRQLITGWGTFRTMVRDQFSSNLAAVRSLPYVGHDLLQSTLSDLNFSDDMFYYRYDGAARLLDLLGYGISINNATIDSESEDATFVVPQLGNISPLFLAAYQKIYFDHYRNTAYESNDVSSYNLDSFIGISGVGNELSVEVLKKLLTLRYANMRKDYVHNFYPSLNFVQSQTNVSTSLPSNVVGYGETQPGVSSSSGAGNVVFPSIIQGNSQGAFTTTNLRAAFALEKLLRASAFAPQHVKDQFKARFGYSPKAESGHESMRIGGFKATINIGEVTSTADTKDNDMGLSLGSIGGKGVGAADYSRPIDFTPDEDGIIMAISYVLPTTMYDSRMIDPIHQKFNPEDWYQTEYLNLGLQPLLQKHCWLYHNPNSSDSDNLAANNFIKGLSPRDMELKLSVDKNHGMFYDGQPLSPYSIHGQKRFGPTSAQTGANYTYFKFDPADLDSVFVQQFDGSEYSDQFFGTIHTAFACVQNLPTLGIPNL